MEITAFKTSTEETYFVTGGTIVSGGGGGGLTEPVIFGINTLTPQTLPTTTTIAWNIKNPQHIILDRAVEFEFASLPVNGSYEGILVIIDIDATGGFDSPIWPASLVNPPVIPTTPLSRFSVMLYTIDNGTVVTHATSVGSSSSGSSFSGNLSDLVINTTKNWLAQGISNFGNLTGVTGIDMDGATATIQGVQFINLFQTDQQIDSTSSGIMYQVGDLQSHLFKSQSTNIAQFEELAANVFRLNMLDHSVRDALDVTLSNASGVPVFAGTSPAFGFNSISSSLVINVPTGAKIAISENNVIGSTQIFDDGVISDTITADSDLFIGVLGTSPPTVAGQFTNDATDVFVFSGGAPRNLSNISTTVAATRELDNLTTTSINAALLPNASGTLDFGSELLPWRIGHFREIEFPITVSEPSPGTDNQISVTTTTGTMAFNVDTVAAGFKWYFEGVNKWSMTPTQFSGDFILLENSLVFNDSTTNPIGDGELTRNGSSVILQSPTTQFQRAATGTNSGQLALVKVDAAPSGGEAIYRINFKLFDNPTTITYAQIKGGIEDVTDAGTLELGVRSDGVSNVNALLIEGSPGTTNRTFVSLNAESRIGSDLKFQAPTGSTDLKIFPALNQLGIVVQDNVSFTVGTAGSLVPPIVNTIPANAAGADSAFGNHNGAIGLFDNEVDDMAFFIRQLDGNWSALFVTTYDFLT